MKILVATFALCAVADARADETIVVVDTAPAADRDRDRALGDAPFVTVLHPDEHPADASVADAVATAAGAHVQSLGGLGAFQSVSVRGAAPGHTTVLVDGVPLARIAAVTTDLGRFAMSAFGEVDFYRGAVPVELGGAGVGGALNLVTRLGRGEHGERVSLSAGMGSFGARHLRAHYGDTHGDGGWLASSTTIGYAGATGDYTYYDDNSTALNPDDDSYKRRANNGFDQVDAATRLGAKRAAGGARVAWKQQGLPGSTAQPALAANLETLDAVADGRVDLRPGGGAVWRQQAFLLVERQRLRDPDGELGLGAQQRRYTTLSGGASSAWHAPLGEHRLAMALELRGDRFADDDVRETGTRAPSGVGTRIGAAPMLALDLQPAPDVVVTPAIRVDALRTSAAPMATGAAGAQPAVPARVDVVPSPRVTARFAATGDIAVKASGGWYARLPTLLEVFGDRGYILGAPGLRPEHGPSGDAGLVWAPAAATGPIDRILVEADAFANRAHDTIALVTTAGYVARATNIGDTQAYGAELTASARLARTLSLTASYTRLETEQISLDASVDGKPVPRQPAHALYARASIDRAIAHHEAGAYADIAWQSDTFLDPASLGRVPGRALVGCGARVAIGGGASIGASVANLFDVRVAHVPLVPPPSPTLTDAPTALSDVAGFPLPGRSIYVSVDWNH